MRKSVLKAMNEILWRNGTREEILDHLLAGGEEKSSHATVTRLLYGSLRYFLPLWEQFESLGAKKTPKELKSLLVMGAYQLGWMDSIPDYAAVNETLAATPAKYRGLKKRLTWLLWEWKRQFLGKPLSFEKFPQWYCQILNSLPDPEIKKWLQKNFLAPTQGVSFFLPENVSDFNEYRIRPDVPLYQMESMQVHEREQILKSGGAVCDPFSIVVPWYFTDESPHDVLDLCSAPGNKLKVLLERFPKADFVSVERSRSRCEIMKTLLGESSKRVDFIIEDAVACMKQWNKEGRKFDKILLDAPCSGLGTVCSNPEYLVSKNEKSLEGMANEQIRLLKYAKRLLRAGGELVYSVCTFSLDETERVIESAMTEELELAPIIPVAGEKVFHGKWGSWLLPPEDAGEQVFYVSKMLYRGV
jgi:16S rRNA (cytosine967-C5)-methyltransferase